MADTVAGSWELQKEVWSTSRWLGHVTYVTYDVTYGGEQGMEQKGTLGSKKRTAKTFRRHIQKAAWRRTVAAACLTAHAQCSLCVGRGVGLRGAIKNGTGAG